MDGPLWRKIFCGKRETAQGDLSLLWFISDTFFSLLQPVLRLLARAVGIEIPASGKHWSRWSHAKKQSCESRLAISKSSTKSKSTGEVCISLSLCIIIEMLMNFMYWSGAFSSFVLHSKSRISSWSTAPMTRCDLSWSERLTAIDRPCACIAGPNWSKKADM